MAAMLLICLFNLPYFLEKVLNALVFSVFLLLALMTRKEKKEMIIFVSLAITFQPFFDSGLDLQAWQMIQIITSAYLILDFFKEKEFQ